MGAFAYFLDTSPRHNIIPIPLPVRAETCHQQQQLRCRPTPGVNYSVDCVFYAGVVVFTRGSVDLSASTVQMRGSRGYRSVPNGSPTPEAGRRAWVFNGLQSEIV